MRILVTGSEGTLGQKLVAELRGRGHEVFGLDLQHGVDVHRADIANWRQLERAWGAAYPEFCYHLAAEFGRMNGDHFPEQLWATNCLGTRNVIEMCTGFMKCPLVMASSSEAYGDAADLGELHEDVLNTHVPKFHNEYALTKWANEKQVEIGINNWGLKAVTLRFFNAYGPGEYYNDYRSVVCLFVYRIMKGIPITVFRNYHRVFMYVDDWARTVANVADRFGKVNGQTINIGGEEYVEVAELVKMIEEKLGKKAIIHWQDKEIANITNKRPNIERAKELLDHQCRVKLGEGLDRTIEWMKQTYA